MKKWVIVLLIILLSGCVALEERDEERLHEIQLITCEEAGNNGACQTRLIEIGIIMPNECCELFSLCCENE